VLDWTAIEDKLNESGYATTAPILNPDECRQLISLYGNDQHFRSRIVMERFRFGLGEYKYFSYPLPSIVEKLRTKLYPPLAKIAARWSGLIGTHRNYPGQLEDYLKVCHSKGQTRPTPLILRYQVGGYNCLHQDLYGELVFPFQCTILLSATADFKGGEFLLVEQRPRAQSRGEAITIQQGEMILFPVNERPVRGARGYYRTNMRHGVSTIRKGERYTLGIIFHDAK
jgi:uncharacterized protein